jgi:hypothetical protein
MDEIRETEALGTAPYGIGMSENETSQSHPRGHRFKSCIAHQPFPASCVRPLVFPVAPCPV